MNTAPPRHHRLGSRRPRQTPGRRQPHALEKAGGLSLQGGEHDIGAGAGEPLGYGTAGIPPEWHR